MVDNNVESEFDIRAECDRRIIISYAIKLLQLTGSRTLFLGYDNMDHIFVSGTTGRFSDELDICYEG